MAAVVEKDTLGELDEREQSLTADIERLEGEVGGLRADVAGLVLDAPTGQELKAAKDGLRKAAGRLQTAQEDLEHVRLAKVEWSRRETARIVQEERERREAELETARSLQGERKKAAAKIDQASELFAEATKDWQGIAGEQRAAFIRAGMLRAAQATASRLEGRVQLAMAHALMHAGVGTVLGPEIGLGPVVNKRPLVESDSDVSGWPLPPEPEEND